MAQAESPDLPQRPAVTEFTVTRRAIATARFAEFRNQCERLSTLARTGMVEVSDAIECLWDAAMANSLVRTHDHADIEQIINSAFNWREERGAA